MEEHFGAAPQQLEAGGQQMAKGAAQQATAVPKQAAPRKKYNKKARAAYQPSSVAKQVHEVIEL